MADGGAGSQFPIVGVGASAGGLEAYRDFLSAMPRDPGVAFVFVQHLDPSHNSMMADLLDKYSPLPVAEAGDATQIEPNHVYTIPPNKFLRIADNGLFLDEPVRLRGTRMPIDYFFRSLAEVQRERAICVILSGTGTDGTQGLKEVKAAGGMCMVQDPNEAAYDGMPRSAIGTGMADFIVPIDEMPQIILNFIKHPYLKTSEIGPGLSQSDPDTFKAILNLLLAQTDYDFRCYKSGTLERRIQRRMGLRHLTNAGEYLAALRNDRDELRALFKDLLIGVTRFFRDTEVWENLREMVIAPLVAKRGLNTSIRIWVPGCATGEEAYSIAILFFEEFERQRRSLPLQIYATDLDEDAIEVARAARYPDAIAGDISADRLERYFVADSQSYVVSKRVRESIVFATQNVISDPPFSNIDLISCRNLMIYLDTQIQKRLLELFHFALAEDGVLLLGTSESTEKADLLFERLPPVERAFRRIDVKQSARAAFPVIAAAERGRSDAGRRRAVMEYRESSAINHAKDLLMEAFVPASVLVDRRSQIQYFHGPVRNYLDFPKGEPMTDLNALALEGMKTRLRAALNKAQQEDGLIEETVRRVRRNGDLVSIRISVQPVDIPGRQERLFAVSFTDEELEPSKSEKEQAEDRDENAVEGTVSQLEYELQTMREDYQSVIEELETSNEELKASNEEVMSMNEELQSTNEELETSREELQSLNEELTTLNNQLQEKLKELEAVNNDLSNLLSSTDIATIFLDSDLNIRRFTPAAKRLLRVIEGDVGRPISDLSSAVDDPGLIEDAGTVLSDLKPQEVEVSANDDTFYLRRIRPYRTSDNRIEGVVVTYTDVTALRNVIDALDRRERQQASLAQMSLETIKGAETQQLFDEAVAKVKDLVGASHAKVLEYRPATRDFVIRAAVGFENAKPGETIVSGNLNSQAGYTLAEDGPVIVKDLRTERRFNGPALLRDAGIISGMSVPIRDAHGVWGVLGVHVDEQRDFSTDDINFLVVTANLITSVITDHASQAEREELITRLDTVLDSAKIGTWIWDVETDRSHWDERMYDMLGIPRETPPSLEGFMSIIHPDDRESVRKAAENMLATGAHFNEEFRMLAKDGSISWLVGIGQLKTEADGTRRVFGVNYEITHRIHEEQRLRESEARRELALDAAHIGTWEMKPGSGEVEADERLCEMIGIDRKDKISVAEFEEHIHPEDRDRRARNIAAAAEQNTAFNNEFRIRRDGEERWLSSTGRLFTHEHEPKVVGLAFDITERKRIEERQQLIMAELDHRVKNILANVNAIARQTARGRSDPDEFVDALEGRLSAMADAHSLISISRWTGVDLKQIVEVECSPYMSGVDSRIEISGESFMLSPSAAQVFSLFLHELSTNAAKHGALSTETGKLEVSWVVDGDGEFTFNWAEKATRKISKPKHQGFGLRVIEQMSAAELRANVTLSFEPSGLICRLVVPKSEIEARQVSSMPSVLPAVKDFDEHLSQESLSSLAPKRLFLVEDSWALGHHLREMLEAAGHTVTGLATRLDEALQMVEGDGIDAAILDIHVHDDVVYSVARRLAERGIPFGFATGYSTEEQLPEDLAERPIIGKPYDATSISKLLARLMDK